MPLRLTRILTKAPAFPHARQSPLRIPPSHLSVSITTTASTISPQQSPFLSFQSRKMSSAPKKEFLCILPDKPGAQAKRLEVRP